MKAINFATQVHNGQTRKTNGLPKIVHLYGVAMLLSKYGYSEELIIAGLLHDVLEDCKDYSVKDIIELFGQKVADYVLDVTEPNKDIEWKKRKSMHIEHLKTVSLESKVLCAADKIHNLLSLQADLKKQGEAVWNCFNASKQDIFVGIILLYVIVLYLVMKKTLFQFLNYSKIQ